MHLRASHKAQPKYTFPPLESQTEFAPGCRSGQSGGLSVPAVCSNSSPPPRRNPVRCADHVRHDGLGDCRDTQNSPEQWYLIGSRRRKGHSLSWPSWLEIDHKPPIGIQERRAALVLRQTA